MNLTALCIAVQKRNKEIINILLSHKDTDINYVYHVFFLDILMEFNFFDIYTSALFQSLKKKYIDIFILLISNPRTNVNVINVLQNCYFHTIPII